jgi:hypothetical protein
MKKTFFILFILMASCAEDDINSKTSACIDSEKWGAIMACPEYIDHVCGCDNVTYANDCFAKAAGVVSWTDGACN